MSRYLTGQANAFKSVMLRTACAPTAAPLSAKRATKGGRAKARAYLEIATAQDKVDLDVLLLFEEDDRFVHGVQLAMAAPNNHYLQPRPFMRLLKSTS
jgi:hypothetical protein